MPTRVVFNTSGVVPPRPTTTAATAATSLTVPTRARKTSLSAHNEGGRGTNKMQAEFTNKNENNKNRRTTFTPAEETTTTAAKGRFNNNKNNKNKNKKNKDDNLNDDIAEQLLEGSLAEQIIPESHRRTRKRNRNDESKVDDDDESDDDDDHDDDDSDFWSESYEDALILETANQIGTPSHQQHRQQRQQKQPLQPSSSRSSLLEKRPSTFSTRKRSINVFRTSILRELEVRGDDDDDDDDDDEEDQEVEEDHDVVNDDQNQNKQQNNRNRNRYQHQVEEEDDQGDDDDDDEGIQEGRTFSYNKRNPNTINPTLVDANPAASASASSLSPMRRTSSYHRRRYRRRSSSRRHSNTTAIAQQQQQTEVSKQQQQQQLSTDRISSDDIRASTRLLGYLFSVISGTVMIVSMVQFYRDLQDASTEDEDTQQQQQGEGDGNDKVSGDNDDDDDDRFLDGTVGLVFRWKFWAAMYIATAGVALCLLTLLVHFDTFLAPSLWVAIFRDGSLAERNWIFFLSLLWMGAVHAGTSSLSVGESQANVFFTAWTAFASIASNFGVWRESAGFDSLAEQFFLECQSETTYNWIWTAIFSAVFAGSATDIYYNRDDINLRFRGERLVLDQREWNQFLIIVWAEVGLCLVAVALNELLPKSSWRFPTGQLHCQQTPYRLVYGWRQLEGPLIFAAVAVKFWFILRNTGVDGVINGLNNAYFGVFGSFFNSVFTFGSWLRENEHIEYFVRENNNNTGNNTSPNEDKQQHEQEQS